MVHLCASWRFVNECVPDVLVQFITVFILIQIRFEDIHSSITNGNFTNFLYFINICNLCKIGETIIKICYVLNMNSYPISFGHICFKMFVA